VEVAGLPAVEVGGAVVADGCVVGEDFEAVVGDDFVAVVGVAAVVGGTVTGVVTGGVMLGVEA
jgi:hypothetical protein